MSEGMFMTEIVAQAKVDDLKRAIERARVEAIIDAPASHLSVRGTLASALVRIAMFVDANAGRRAATLSR
jgi:hypothetical protein